MPAGSQVSKVNTNPLSCALDFIVKSMDNSINDISRGYRPLRESENLYRLLDAVLTSQGKPKIAAKQAIKKVEVADDYPVQLTEILLNPAWREEVRILASDKLNKFLKAFCCVNDKNCRQLKMDLPNKSKIKELLLTGLSESKTEVRAAVADTVCTFVLYDSPSGQLASDWPEFVDTLVNYLNGESKSGLDGALLVLDDPRVLYHIEQHSVDAVDIILREMNRIFALENQYSIEIRCMARDVLAVVVLIVLRSQHRLDIQRHVRPAVLQFHANSMQIWRSTNSSRRLKRHIMGAWIMWMNDGYYIIPKYLLELLADMMPLVWESLIDHAKQYYAHLIKGGEGLEKLNVPLTFLITVTEAACDDKSLKDQDWFYLHGRSSTPYALRHVIMLAEITDEQTELWKTDVDDFLEIEDWEDQTANCIRQNILHFILNIQILNGGPADHLIMVIMRYLEEENERRINDQSGVNQHDWRSHEAFLLAFGLMKDSIISRYNVVPFLANIVLADLKNSASHPLLVGRCLILGGIYSDQLPSKIASAFLEATVNSLQENQPQCVKICAAMAVHLLYLAKNSDKIKNKMMFSTHIPALFEGLSAIAKTFKSKRVENLLVKSIASLMPFDNEVFAVTQSVASRIYSLTEISMLKHNFRSLDAWRTIFKELMLHPKCVPLFQERLTKTLLSFMTITPKDRSFEGEAAIIILLVLVEHSALPLSRFLVDPLFPAACNYIASTDNLRVIGNTGIELIRKYLPSVSQKTIRYEDPNGRYGAQYILKVIVHTLNKLQHESFMTTFERLYEILILLMKTAWCEMRQDLDDLLKALLHHTQTAEKSIGISRPLLMVYAYLIHKGSDTFFNYLANALSPADQKNCLVSVIAHGFGREYNSVDDEERETMKSAFGKIIEYGRTNLSSPSHEITLEEISGQLVLFLVKVDMN